MESLGRYSLTLTSVGGSISNGVDKAKWAALRSVSSVTGAD